MGYRIAIDGPAGAGKSTIAKKLAEHLKFIYVDTGAMYRAMGLSFFRNHIDDKNQEEVARVCQDTDITIEYVDGAQQVFLNGENVTKELRSENAGKMASLVGKLPQVRTKLVDLQQKLARQTHVVMDGRDIGTVVLPDADIKIFLTASVKTRAQRRFLELTEKEIPCKIEKIEEDIQERDRQDTKRELSPLQKAEDAVTIDSSDLTVDQVVEQILELFKQKTGERI